MTIESLILSDENNQTSNCVKIEYIYEQVQNNITNIINKYEHILKNNSTTKKYLNEGYDQQTAYILSFSTTIMLYLQINGVNVI
jgi:hypothetical protein